jgi:NAD+ synthase (glutamine-hydrolysing)
MINENLNILMAQINPVVGAIHANQDKILKLISEKQNNHDIIVFPELTITGYPPEDLLFRKEFQHQVVHSLKAIQEAVDDCYIIVGHPTWESEGCYNSLSIFHNKQKIRTYHKQNLPNYEIFDESRYFIPGPQDPCTLNIKNQKIGICICEDLWQQGPAEDLINNEVSTIISINASPFDYDKYFKRLELIKKYALRGVHIVYVNQVGGQDDLLFDGQSLVMDKTGEICVRSPVFKEDFISVELQHDKIVGPVAPLLGIDELIYQALVFGTKEYVEKNKFPGVIIGLSGGIDSALTLAIAVDALGSDRVHAVMMPSRYTASMSNEDALEQIKTMNVSYSTLAIEPIVETVNTTLKEIFKGLDPDLTEENIQARIRGMLLMALSNKTGKMVLTTSNKSESAVGYATLYGDMAGGFSVLKDVLKTQVYALAAHRNTLSPVIPERVITRAPSAELRANQKDQDSLPEYPILDTIIVGYMEDNLTAGEIIQEGFDPQVVDKVIKLIKRNEYKRRQAAPGIKISPVAFGKDWRYPITNGFE